MRDYEVLFRYLKTSNYNEDGSPSDDDDYYMIGKVRAKNRNQIQKWADDYDIESMLHIGKCRELSQLFNTDEYVEDSLEIIKVLSQVGHEII